LTEIIYLMLIWNVAQAAFFIWQIQKLINKLMSRSFYDYEISTRKPDLGRSDIKIKLDEDNFEVAPPKDLSF